MGFLNGNLPPVEPDRLFDLPYLERIRVLSRHWAEHGFGAPKITHVVYVAKLLVLYVGGGYLVASATSGLSPLHPAAWWTEPIVYQKLILWTLLLECLGLGGSWGPMAGHFKPFTCGWRTYFKVDTIRQPPWPGKVPFTRGDRRSGVDVALYAALLGTILAALAGPGVSSPAFAVLGFRGGQVSPTLMIVLATLLVAAGLRDKVLFLQARGEQYLPAVIFFAAYGGVDMIVALKLLIVVVWVGAGFSKFGRHFGNVVPPMVSNTPWVPRKWRRANYVDLPHDLRPSHRAKLLAHVGGTFVEIVAPLVLLLSTNPTVTILAAALMVCFHLFITSTFPLAVPLEWNILFAFGTVFLFLGHPTWAGYGVADMSPALLVVTLAGLLLFPILGNLRPDLVSFLPSMRQYAGNWASATWAFAPGAEARLDACLVKPAAVTVNQLVPTYGRAASEVIMYQMLGWRAMHSQGRALNSILVNQLGPDIDRYTLREAEFATNCIVGFNFGDGHLHDAKFIESIQRRCGFEPGEFIVVWIESQPVHKNYQRYQVIDAAMGVVERGTYLVADAVSPQPWLPDGPIPITVEWRLPSYQRVSHPVVPAGSVSVEVAS